MSAYVYIFRQFDYSTTPIVPPGTKALAHFKPSVIASRRINGEEYWTIGPSLEHYMYIQCYLPKTRSVRDIGTATFFTKVISFQKVNTDEFLRQAAEDIIIIPTAPPTKTIPSLEAGDTTRNTLLK